MAEKSRAEIKARYELFDRHALKDQRWYYQETIERHGKALVQVNFIRATLALSTGVAAGLAAVIQQSAFVGSGACSVESIADNKGLVPLHCTTYQVIILLCVVLSVVLPALGAFFNSLMDLYQWDRLVGVYESAVENINVADALSPDDSQSKEGYVKSYKDYIEGTLQVMSDETAQWGQSIRTPRATEKFLEEARLRSQNLNADADAARDAVNKPAEGEA
jgi:hypothetical protein